MYGLIYKTDTTARWVNTGKGFKVKLLTEHQPASRSYSPWLLILHGNEIITPENPLTPQIIISHPSLRQGAICKAPLFHCCHFLIVLPNINTMSTRTLLLAVKLLCQETTPPLFLYSLRYSVLFCVLTPFCYPYFIKLCNNRLFCKSTLMIIVDRHKIRYNVNRAHIWTFFIDWDQLTNRARPFR